MDSSRIGIAEEGGPYSYHPLADGDTISSDDVRLKQLGYKQELTRGLSYACFLFFSLLVFLVFNPTPTFVILVYVRNLSYIGISIFIK